MTIENKTIDRILQLQILKTEIDILIRTFENKVGCDIFTKAQIKALEFNKKHNLKINSQIGLLMAINELQ